jgi:hypothetical protein
MGVNKLVNKLKMSLSVIDRTELPISQRNPYLFTVGATVSASKPAG